MKSRKHNKNFVRVARARFWDSPAGLMLLLLVSVSLLIFSTFYPGSADTLRMRAIDSVAPLVEGVSIPFQNVVATVRGVSGLAKTQEKIAFLQDENSRLREWFQRAQTLESENAALRELLNVKVDPARDFITARIVSDSGMTFVKSLIVNAGVNDKVSKNDAVLSGQGLVGRVIEVGNNSARVLLVTDVNSRIPVILEGLDRHAIVGGMNTNVPVLDHVEAETEIPDGTRVVTSGFGGIFPPGLPVGIVRKDGNDYAVDLYSDVSKVRFVRIVSEAKDTNLKQATDIVE